MPIKTTMTQHWVVLLGALSVLSCTISTQVCAHVVSPTPAWFTAASHGVDQSIWNSPRFKKSFAESYLSETEVEPRISQDEARKMIRFQELMGEGKEKEAIQLLERERGDDTSAVFNFTLANVLFEQEQLEDAIVAYREAVSKHPKFLRAWKLLGLAHMRLQQTEDAIEALTETIRLGGADGLIYGLLGFAHSNNGQALAAESAYRMAIMVDPTTTEWRMGLAKSLFEQQRFPEVASYIGSMIEESPDRADLWLLQANALLGMGETMKAAENFLIVDGLGGSTPDTLNMLGDIYTNASNYDLATTAYIKALVKTDAPTPDRALRAARVLAARSAFEETRLLLDEIDIICQEKLNADQKKDILKLRARIAISNQASDEEARILREIVDLDPLDGEAMILLGVYHERCGELDEAVFLFERAANLDDHEADAKVRHAQLLVRHGQHYAEAIKLLKRAQQIKPREHVRAFLEQIERVAR